MKKIAYQLASAFLIILFFYVRLANLSGGLTVDEPTWRQRVIGFYKAISTGDFKNTYQSGHPGVITMYTGGIPYGLANLYKDIFHIKRDIISSNRWTIGSMRLGIILLNTAMTGYLFYLLYKRLKKPVWAIAAVILIGFEPFIIRFTRLIHVDGIVSMSVTLVAILFLIYIKENKKLDAFMTSVFLAVAMASKTPSLVFLPFALIVITFFAKDRVRSLINLALMVGIAVTIIFIIWPVLWVEPMYAFKDMGLRTLLAIFQPHGATSLKITAPAPDKNYTFYVETIFYFITPLLSGFFLLSLVGTFIAFLKKRSDDLFYLFGTQIFALMFFAAITIGGKQGDRYLLPAIVMMSIASGYFIQFVYDLSSQTKALKKLVYLSFAGLALFYIYNAVRLIPDYEILINPWTPKDPQILMLRTGLGEGLEKAADYLNNKKRPEKLKVAAWYDTSFSPYFIGVTLDVRDKDVMNSDYIVAYGNMYGRSNVQYVEDILNYLKNKAPEKTFYIDGIPYVTIYKNQ